MYVYQLGFPIDDFGMMRHFKEWYDHSVKCDTEDDGDCELNYTVPSILRAVLRTMLRRLAMMDTYWEGDIRGNELYIGSVPDEEDYDAQKYFIALKQDNNGSSFIVSEFPIGHLDNSLVHRELGRPVTEKIQIGIKEILERFCPKQHADQEKIFEYVD